MCTSVCLQTIHMRSHQLQNKMSRRVCGHVHLRVPADNTYAISSAPECLYATQSAIVNDKFEGNPHLCGLKKEKSAKKIQSEADAVSSVCDPCPVSVTECAHRHAQDQTHSRSDPAMEARAKPVPMTPLLRPLPRQTHGNG